MSKKPLYPTVTVEWYDAVSEDAWKSVADLPQLAKVQTTGFLVKKTKQTITICGSYHGLEVGDCITIPRPWIVK
jgi:hypothetical protein